MDHPWVIELEGTHLDRLATIISGIGSYSVIRRRPQKKVGCSALILVNSNVVEDERFPRECFKYISRIFFVPFSCRDPAWLLQRPPFLDLLAVRGVNNSGTIRLRVSCYPKELECVLQSLIIESFGIESVSNYPVKVDLHPTKHDFVLMCVYDRDNDIFDWGIVSSNEFESRLMTTEALSAALLAKRRGDCLGAAPVCRAYFKLDEIVNCLLLRWNWEFPVGRRNQGGVIGIDIGAAPGGWTQSLACKCDAVLSVDPGNLRPEILSLPNVFHIPMSVQSVEVRNEMQYILSPSNFSSFFNLELHRKNLSLNSNQQIRVIVCDVNCDAHTTAKLLSESVLPYIEGFGQCCRSCTSTCNTNYGEKVYGLQPSTTVLLVVTLKLLKNPKPRHIKQAINSLISSLDGVRPDANCSNCRWSWNWSSVGTFDSADVTDCRVGHLCANSANERTIIARRSCYESI